MAPGVDDQEVQVGGHPVREFRSCDRHMVLGRGTQVVRRDGF